MCVTDESGEGEGEGLLGDLVTVAMPCPAAPSAGKRLRRFSGKIKYSVLKTSVFKK